MTDSIVPLPGLKDRQRLKINVIELPPEEQVKIYLQTCEEGLKILPPLQERLAAVADKGQSMHPEKGAPFLRKELEVYQDGLLALFPRLNAALDMPADDPEVLRKKLAQCQADLAEAQQALFKTQQENRNLRQELDKRQGLIDELQKENSALKGQLAEFQGRVSTNPSEFGAALGQAVDAIQQGLTSLDNAFVDYGLQELDLQTQVNIQLDERKQLSIRFPGLNEQIAPQNLTQLNMRLRPIPKSEREKPAG
ncbi:MAG: hypothetical protein MUD01_05445 [Chloroflexaceae bacterium]|jgi:hypothetical protein|nr:hypothetical protein [Chloroflexaceae bacterium]